MFGNETQNTLRNEVIFAGEKSIIYAGGRVLSHAVGFLMIPVYTRFISPSLYGSMELIQIISSCVGILFFMGTSYSMARFYYAESKENEQNEKPKEYRSSEAPQKRGKSEGQASTAGL